MKTRKTGTISDPLLAKQQTLDGLVNQSNFVGNSYANNARMVKLTREIAELRLTEKPVKRTYEKGWSENEILNQPLYVGHISGVKLA